MISSIILSVEDWQIFVHKTFRQILPLSNLGKTKKSDRKLCRYFKFCPLNFSVYPNFLFGPTYFLLLWSGIFLFFSNKDLLLFLSKTLYFYHFNIFSKRTKGIFSIQRSLYGWTKIIFLPIFKILHPHLVQCKENLATTLWFKYCEVDKKFLINWS